MVYITSCGLRPSRTRGDTAMIPCVLLLNTRHFGVCGNMEALPFPGVGVYTLKSILLCSASRERGAKGQRPQAQGLQIFTT